MRFLLLRLGGQSGLAVPSVGGVYHPHREGSFGHFALNRWGIKFFGWVTEEFKTRPHFSGADFEELSGPFITACG